MLELLNQEEIPFHSRMMPTGRWSLLKAIFSTVRLLNREKVSGIVSFLDTPSMITAIANRWAFSSKFHIWGIRNSKIDFKPNRWYKLAYKYSDIKVSNSRSGADSFARIFGESGNNILVIKNGVNIPDIQGTEMTKGQNIVLAMVASKRPQKRYDLLLEYFGRLVESAPHNFELLLVGQGTEELIPEINEQNLDQQVKVLGHVNEIGDLLLNRIDIGILLSDWEGQPNTIIEYMACGLPIVASDIEEIRDCLSSENKSFLVKNYDDFERALISLGDNLDTRRSIGSSNRERAERDFSMQNMIDNYWELINSRIR